MADLAAGTARSGSRRVTIKDIARAAGVSVTTVSDSLSGNGRLPAETRQRVRQLAKELGYRPSAAARSLVGSRTGLLLMSVAAPDTPTSSLWSIDFFTNLMISAAGRAATRGFALALSPASVPPNLSYDGAIVVDPTPDNELLAQAHQEAVPIVTVGRSTQGHPWVDNDYATIVPTVLAHLQTCGARRPALLASDPATSYVRDTAEQYNRWCAEHGCSPRIAYVEGGISQAAGHDAAANLLRGDDRPDAVLTTLDQLAVGVIAAVDELGWSVPGDVLVASLGDSAMITHSRVPITAVDLSPDELGRCAVDMLIDQIEASSPPTNQLVAGRLVVRASTRGIGSSAQA
jgi:DNA-binding LacI/PurR family transcriptional regulator